jgi:ElaB/YqjD/DUF883 family membrane-anchored ribosome-binding protein
MPTNPKDPTGKADDPMAEIARLRAQVEALMHDKAASVVGQAAERIEGAAHDAAGEVRERAEALAGAVRERPLTSLLIAAAVGYLLGRSGR